MSRSWFLHKRKYMLLVLAHHNAFKMHYGSGKNVWRICSWSWGTIMHSTCIQMHYGSLPLWWLSERTIMHSNALCYLLWLPKESLRIFVSSSLIKSLLVSLQLACAYSWYLEVSPLFIFDTHMITYWCLLILSHSHIDRKTRTWFRCIIVPIMVPSNSADLLS